MSVRVADVVTCRRPSSTGFTDFGHSDSRLLVIIKTQLWDCSIEHIKKANTINKMIRRYGMNFSEKLQKVENIVQKLENEELPLEQALSLYEDGITLIRELQTFLQRAEQKVMVLSDDLKEEPFDANGEDR